MKRADALEALLDGTKAHLAKVADNLIGDAVSAGRDVELARFHTALDLSIDFFDAASVYIKARIPE